MHTPTTRSWSTYSTTPRPSGGNAFWPLLLLLLLLLPLTDGTGTVAATLDNPARPLAFTRDDTSLVEPWPDPPPYESDPHHQVRIASVKISVADVPVGDFVDEEAEAALDAEAESEPETRHQNPCVSSACEQ